MFLFGFLNFFNCLGLPGCGFHENGRTRGELVAVLANMGKLQEMLTKERQLVQSHFQFQALTVAIMASY